MLYDYPASPGGLATQGHLLYRGLTELGVDVYPVNSVSDFEKEWYYRWFKPDVAIGVGYWGHLSDLVLHPNKHGVMAVPWLVADGYIAKHQELLNKLPLILVTSNWVKEMYVRDGINAEHIEVLPVGCDTDAFVSAGYRDPKIRAIRESLGLTPDQLMILTIGGDAASKGAREVMQALAQIDGEVPDWKYICKVWPQPRTEIQNLSDRELAVKIGIADKVRFINNITSRNLMPSLIAACDIYAAPSRLEGFGMPQIEAGSCEKPVLGIEAMGMLDTLLPNKTALLAKVAQKIVVNEVYIPDGTDSGHKIKIQFDTPRTVDFRADVQDIAFHLKRLMLDKELRLSLGKAARSHVATHFDYRIVAKRFLKILKEKLEIV